MTNQTNQIDDAEPTFTFWLHDWGTRPFSVGGNRPACIRCEIDRDWLRVFGGPQITETPTDNIESVKIWSWAGVPAVVVSINVLLRLKQPVEIWGRKIYDPNDLVVAPIDVYRFRNDLNESQAMRKVIQSFQAGVLPDIKPNPYLRCRRPRDHVALQSPDGPWDPAVPPYVYSEPPYSPRRQKETLVAIAVAIFIVGPIAAVIFGLILSAWLGQLHIG